MVLAAGVVMLHFSAERGVALPVLPKCPQVPSPTPTLLQADLASRSLIFPYPSIVQTQWDASQSGALLLVKWQHCSWAGLAGRQRSGLP
jgi:hypothetical protein